MRHITTLILLLLATYASCQDTGISDFSRRRDLVNWSSFTTWGSWKTQSGCSFVNGLCTNDPRLKINSDPYEQKTQYLHWVNAVASGYITLNDSNEETLSMRHKPTALVGQNSLWEWKVSLTDYHDVVLNLYRNFMNYEDIVVVAYTEDGSQQFTSKELSDCVSDTMDLYIKSVKYIQIRVNKLSSLSNYSIELHKVSRKSETNSALLLAIILTSILLCIVTTTTCLILYAAREWLKDRRRVVEQRRTLQEMMQNRAKNIEETMNNMKHGQFQYFENKYHEDNWVICLESFKPDSEIHITNECSHVYHSSCLKEWYENIDAKKDLKCPHCNSVNRPNKENNGSLELISGELPVDPDPEAVSLPSGFYNPLPMVPNINDHNI